MSVETVNAVTKTVKDRDAVLHFDIANSFQLMER